MRECCDGLMNDRHLKLWRTMVQMYSWQRQTPMWVNIKDSFKQLFLIQDSTIHHHVLWFWSRRVREVRVKFFYQSSGYYTSRGVSRDICLCTDFSDWRVYLILKTGNPQTEIWKLWQQHFKILCLNLTHSKVQVQKIKLEWTVKMNRSYTYLFVSLYSFSSLFFRVWLLSQISALKSTSKWLLGIIL